MYIFIVYTSYADATCKRPRAPGASGAGSFELARVQNSALGRELDNLDSRRRRSGQRRRRLI